jgi:hypothetical protein
MLKIENRYSPCPRMRSCVHAETPPATYGIRALDEQADVVRGIRSGRR